MIASRLLSALAGLLAAAAEAPPPSPPSPGQTAEAYDAQVRREAGEAQALLGPLDGSFVLVRKGGRPVYAFELVDPGLGASGLEGVWRKLGGGRGSGLVGLMTFDGPQLVMRFDERPGRLVAITLDRQADGAWGGRMWRLGFNRPVILRRQAP